MSKGFQRGTWVFLSSSCLLFLVLGGMDNVVQAATQYNYVATTKSKSAVQQGLVRAGSLTWRCSGSECRITGPWPTPGIGSCQALAKQVGPIARYGHSGKWLDAGQLAKCNKGISASASMIAPKAPPGSTNPTISPPARGLPGIAPPISSVGYLKGHAADKLRERLVDSAEFISGNGDDGNTIIIRGQNLGPTPTGKGVKALVQAAPRFSGRCILPENHSWCRAYAGNHTLKIVSWNNREIVAKFEPRCNRQYDTYRCLTLREIRRFMAGSITIGPLNISGRWLVRPTRLDIVKPWKRGPDADGDGQSAVSIGGRDCDDQDARRFAGNAEAADYDGLDEDCDPLTYGTRDVDRDGVHDYLIFNILPDGRINRGLDCNDNEPGTHPYVPEVCDGKDNNCDGVVDENCGSRARR